MPANVQARKLDKVYAQPGGVKESAVVGIYPVSKKPNGKRTLGQGVKLQWFPNSFSVKRSNSYEDLQPIGMNDPKKFYTGGETTITITVPYVVGRADGHDIISILATLSGYMRNNGAKSPPQLLYLDFGPVTNTMSSPSNRWLLTDMPAEFHNFMPALDYAPFRMTVDLTFTLVPNRNIPASDRSY